MKWNELVLQISLYGPVRRTYAVLRRTPILGSLLRHLIRGGIPAKTYVWLRISGGLGQGLWAHLDPRFETDYSGGEYEPRIQQALSQYLKPGSVFYDVG